MTIVCGTDFSDNADRAANAAAALARSMRVPLKLVHAIVETVPDLPQSSPPDAVYYPLHSTLSARAKALGDRFGIEVEPVVLRGSPHDELVKYGREQAARLIVVSALGSGKQRAWLLGSVAERVAQASSLPVLVVRDADSIVAWANREKRLRVMVAADLGSSSKAALRWASELEKWGASELTVAQVTWPVGERARLGLPVLEEMDRLRPEIMDLLLRDLRAWAAPISRREDVRFLVSPGWGRIDNHIALLAAHEKSELIVVGTHHRATIARCWLGSVSRGVVHYATTNVVCVPRPAQALDEPSIEKFGAVLVPTDLSELGNRAALVGYGLVAEGGTVHLLYVSSKHHRVEGDLQAALAALVPQGAAGRGISTEIHVVEEEDVANAIWHAAGRLGADVICMSTHGRSGLSSLVMGSRAQEVVRRARQPVMLVPPERRV